MLNENLQLIEPTEELADDLAAMLREYDSHGTEGEKALYADALADIPAYVRKLQDESRGIALPEGYVPSPTYWLVRDGERIVAASNLRHRLTESLLHEGGHIGYGTRPSERGKGYGTPICRRTIEKARDMGISRVLITCDDDTPASARIIEAGGGVMENTVISRVTGKLKRRYWIDM